MKTLTGYFPLPYELGEIRTDGFAIPIAEQCQSCRDRQCRRGKSGQLGVCSFGFSYLKMDESLLLLGFVLENSSFTSPARKKEIRRAVQEGRLVQNSVLEKATGLIQVERDATRIASEAVKEAQLEVATEDPALLEKLREEARKGLSFVHDYKQINTQIAHGINVVLERAYPKLPLDDQLDAASEAEKAIYYASKLLTEKLDAASLLLDTAWLYQASKCGRFRVHGLVTKYSKIYRYQAGQRGIAINVHGSNQVDTVANSQACGIIAHTLIDNAIKYSPASGTVDILVQDEDEGVLLSVESQGPRLLPDEHRKIFRPFYRGQFAKEVASEGMGYGLYASQHIAREHLGTKITVEQEENASKGLFYRTTFEITFPRKAKVAL